MVEARNRRIPVMMSSDELKVIDDWRYQNRVATRAEAIRRLSAMGLIFDDYGQEFKQLIELIARWVDSRSSDIPTWNSLHATSEGILTFLGNGSAPTAFDIGIVSG